MTGIIVILLLLRVHFRQKKTVLPPESPKFSWKKFTDLAFEYRRKKDYKSAIAITDLVLRYEERNYDALMCRALSLSSLSFHREAVADFDIIMGKKKCRSRIKQIYARSLLWAGRFDEAESIIIEPLSYQEDLSDEDFANAYESFIRNTEFIEKVLKIAVIKPRPNFGFTLSNSIKAELSGAIEIQHQLFKGSFQAENKNEI